MENDTKCDPRITQAYMRVIENYHEVILRNGSTATPTNCL